MSEITEEEYISSLKQQSHMYEWCLKNIGGLTTSEAKLEAEKLYTYVPPSEKYRWLVFHDDAWHWAMLKINGEQYWTSFPELAHASPEYEQELEEYDKANT